MRALVCVVAVASDEAHLHPDLPVRERARARLALLTPVVKAWCTESAIQLTSLGLQVHGGMGYVEETGAAQYLRDARITTIYEGTTGIQANDLVGRKIVRDNGAAAQALIAEMAQDCALLSKASEPSLRAIGARLEDSIGALRAATKHVASIGRTDLRRALAGGSPLLRLFGTVCGGWQLGRAALAARDCRGGGEEHESFLQSKVLTARFYADNVLCEAGGLAHAVISGADALASFEIGHL